MIPTSYRGRMYDDDRSNGYRVLRVWVKPRARTRLNDEARVLSLVFALATATAPIAPADVVLATSPPLFTGLAGLALARLKRAPFVLDVRDLWPAAAEALNQISGGPRRRGLRAGALLYRRPRPSSPSRRRSAPTSTPSAALLRDGVDSERDARDVLSIGDDRDAGAPKLGAARR